MPNLTFRTTDRHNLWRPQVLSDEPQAVPTALVANLSMLIIPTVPKYWFSVIFTHTGRHSLSPISPNFCSHNNFTRISLKSNVSFCFPLLDSRTCYLDRVKVKAKESIDRIKQYGMWILLHPAFLMVAHTDGAVCFLHNSVAQPAIIKAFHTHAEKLSIFLISSYSL